MATNLLGLNDLKRDLLHSVIIMLTDWKKNCLVFSDQVDVLIEQSGNDTVDVISLKFKRPFELRPGCDTVFLALHYKDADTTYKGDHFRFHHPNYGSLHDWTNDTWVPAPSISSEGSNCIVAHQALMHLITVLEDIRDYCDKGHYEYFEPTSSSFPFFLIITDEVELMKYERLF
tara:strand:+ start:528 stop:1049 length:522 start_codon:yes stop_codon:yes gene_type:complete